MSGSVAVVTSCANADNEQTTCCSVLIKVLDQSQHNQTRPICIVYRMSCFQTISVMRFPSSKHVSGRLQNLEVSVPVSDRAQVTPTLEVSKSQHWCFRCTDSQKGKPNLLLGQHRLCVMCFSHAGSWSVELSRSNLQHLDFLFLFLGSWFLPSSISSKSFPVSL